MKLLAGVPVRPDMGIQDRLTPEADEATAARVQVGPDNHTRAALVYGVLPS